MPGSTTSMRGEVAHAASRSAPAAARSAAGSSARPARSGTRVAASVALMPARAPPAAASGVTATTVRSVAPRSAATGRPRSAGSCRISAAAANPGIQAQA